MKPSLWNNSVTASLKFRIALLVSLLVVSSSLIVTAWIFQKFDAELLASKSNELEAETFLQGLRFMSLTEEVQNDVSFLSGTPPLQGLIRADAHSGQDLLDNSSRKAWLERLSTIFMNLAHAKPHYRQIRYIGVADGGKEIVRVDRQGPGGSLRLVPANQLAKKGHSDYFLRAVQSAPGKVVLSEIELNRENNIISVPHLPVLRAAIPVYGSNGKVHGIVVINQDVQAVFEKIAQVVDTSHTYYLTNGRGDYLFHPDPNKVFRFEFGESARLQDDFPAFAPTYENKGDAKKIVALSDEDENRLVGCLRLVSYDQADSSNVLGILVTAKEQKILAISGSVKKQAILIIAGMLGFTLLAAVILAREVARPIVEVSTAINQFADGDQPPSLPVNAKGEAGQLARSFEAMVGQVRLRSEELRNEAAERRKAEQEAKAVVQSASDAIVTIDDLGILLSFNPRATEMFGYEEAEAIGQNVKILMPSPVREAHDGHLETYRRTQRKTIIGKSRELIAQRKDGTEFEIELTVGEIVAGDQKRFIGIIRDIGERKLAEAALKHSNEELARSNSELEQFSYVASHDLQAPLRTIISFSSLLREHTAELLDEEAQEYMRHTVEAATRMRCLIRDLLKFSRVDSGELVPETVLLDDLYNDVASDLKAPLEESQAVLSKGDLPTVWGDPTQLRRLLQNLVSNSIKYRSKERPCRIHVDSVWEAPHWKISVSDNGQGIAPQHFERIFVIFQRLHGEDYEGTGIGLAICRKIVERHGGRITIESSSDQGTTFFFTLPAPPLPENSPPK